MAQYYQSFSSNLHNLCDPVRRTAHPTYLPHPKTNKTSHVINKRKLQLTKSPKIRFIYHTCNCFHTLAMPNSLPMQLQPHRSSSSPSHHTETSCNFGKINYHNTLNNHPSKLIKSLHSKKLIKSYRIILPLTRSNQLGTRFACAASQSVVAPASL